MAEVSLPFGGTEIDAGDAGLGHFAKVVDRMMGTHSREGIVRSSVSAVDSASTTIRLLLLPPWRRCCPRQH